MNNAEGASGWQRIAIPFALALAAFALYLRTRAPDLLASDAGEFQFAAWNFSFVHPTGYPLFLILGGIFQHLLPIGNPAFRLNVFNAMIAACAVAALYLAAYEITRERIGALFAAASFALSRLFWFNASGAEVYALNALFVTFLILPAAHWKNSPSVRTLAIFCFVYGLALTHHRTILLWAPAFILFFWIAARPSARPATRTADFALRRSDILLFTFCFLLPLLLYAYIPLRAPASPYYQLSIANHSALTLYDNSPQGFLDYVLGRTFAFELGWDATSVARLASTPQLLLGEFGALGLALGVIGLGATIWRREWAWLALLALGFIATISFNATYHIGDIAAYYIPVYLVWAVWIANAGGLIAHGKILNFKSQNRNNYPLRITLLVGAILLVAQIISNFPFADRRHETPRERWMEILAAPVPPNAILISNDRDEMMPLWYLQYVEKNRPDLLGLFPLITPDPKYANVVRLTDSLLDSGRPIYFIKTMPGVEIKYRLDPALAPLVRVLGRAADAPPEHLLNATIANRVRVLGYDLDLGAGAMRVAVSWQAQAKLERNYTTFAHLLNPQGGKIAQSEDHQVGGEFYPSSLWQVGETLRDEHTIPLTGVAPGAYRLFVGMYSQPNLELLGDTEAGIVEIP